jgi:hypothetical protein
MHDLEGAFVCVEPLEGGRGGGRGGPCIPGPRRARALTRVQRAERAWHWQHILDRAAQSGHAIVTDRPLPSADDSPAHGSLADTSLAAAPRVPLRTLGRRTLSASDRPRSAPAARACPSPASRAPAHSSASPGMALMHGARGWRWLLVSRPFYGCTTVGARRLC